MALSVPSVPTIRDSFETKPMECMISPHPAREEVKRLKKEVKTNLRRLPCIIPGTDPVGWSWILLTEAEWDTMQHDLHPTPASTTEANKDNDTEEATPELPPYPNITNPGMFTPDERLTEKQHARAEARCNQDLHLFQHKTNIIQACLQDLEAAIPSELIADLHDEDDALKLSVTPRSLIAHMETNCDILKPKDIDDIMTTLNKPFDESMTMAQCFKRQQKCRDLLKSTDVPLSDATLIWAGRKHFERVPFLQRACREWKKACPLTVTPTWKDFKRHFQMHCNEHIDEQATLNSIGIANSAITKDLEEAHATIATKNTQLEEALAQNALTLAHNEALMALLAEQKQCLTVPTLVETITKSNSTSELTDKGSNQLEVAALSQQIAQLTAALASNQPTKPNWPTASTRPKKKKFPPKGNRKERWCTNNNHCWTHGFDVADSHTSATCKTPAQGHQKEATLTNQMGGSTANTHSAPN